MTTDTQAEVRPVPAGSWSPPPCGVCVCQGGGCLPWVPRGSVRADRELEWGTFPCGLGCLVAAAVGSGWRSLPGVETTESETVDTLKWAGRAWQGLAQTPVGVGGTVASSGPHACPAHKPGPAILPP